ncbi:Schizosaccharomyces specific protein [Schizosaccharomyces osmophilus]|uniref:Schizosaccharomyces specific protein n=1 Tax=Schizosaccharomyces osmophilus TaxID=2545709 RepID=A0AAE9WF63_9SCHI|nr:Schizosaccharomyces specific protein [Schizosaccharomyces osmophilus]WBW74653.1 Schizosaccharomyces specific protein [Schizosaccharomyces osmophilus]
MPDKNEVEGIKHSLSAPETPTAYILQVHAYYLTEALIRKYFPIENMIITWKDDHRVYLTFDSSEQAQSAYLDSLRLGSQFNAVIKPVYLSHDEILRLCSRKRYRVDMDAAERFVQR